MRILQHHAEIAAQIVEIEIADVDAADADGSALDVVEAQQQAGERGLARAGVAHHGDGLARLDAEADVARAPSLRLCRRTRRGRTRRPRAPPETAWRWAGDWISHRRVQQLEDALGGRHGRLQDVVLLAQILNGPEESHAVLEKGHQHAERAARRRECGIRRKPSSSASASMPRNSTTG